MKQHVPACFEMMLAVCNKTGGGGRVSILVVVMVVVVVVVCVCVCVCVCVWEGGGGGFCCEHAAKCRGGSLSPH
jgi:hypothetical protein